MVGAMSENFTELRADEDKDEEARQEEENGEEIAGNWTMPTCLLKPSASPKYGRPNGEWGMLSGSKIWVQPLNLAGDGVELAC